MDQFNSHKTNNNNNLYNPHLQSTPMQKSQKSFGPYDSGLFNETYRSFREHVADSNKKMHLVRKSKQSETPLKGSFVRNNI